MTLRAESAADLQTVHTGQPEVEDEQVHASLKAGVQRRGPVFAYLHLVPFAAQGACERLRDGSVILGEQYSGHGQMVVRSGARQRCAEGYLGQHFTESAITFEYARTVPENHVIHISTASIPGQGVTYGDPTSVALPRDLRLVRRAEGLCCAQGWTPSLVSQ
ncbi:hypothetical protein GCM10018779_56010 [Streptomyces griseocarneus]|nr:hypothetical protein GCM10018779_56010 [Streptomyces griseocarneus]